MKRLSVIIPAYDDLASVLVAINSLRALATGNNQIEYLVQDDCSPNMFLPAMIPPEVASVARNEQNLGFGMNCNTAAARATGQYLFFVNQDVYAVPNYSEGWDRAIIDTLDDMPQVGIVGGRLLFPDGRVQSAGGLFDKVLQPYHPCLGWTKINHPDVATARRMPWVTGAALATRKWLFDQVGGFDPMYEGGYWEDVDLCLRVKDAGMFTYYQPGATLIHRVGSSGGNPHFMKNAQRFYDRWVKTKKITADVPVIMERFWTQ